MLTQAWNFPVQLNQPAIEQVECHPSEIGISDYGNTSMKREIWAEVYRQRKYNYVKANLHSWNV
jgi:hypothetical protein